MKRYFVFLSMIITFFILSGCETSSPVMEEPDLTGIKSGFIFVPELNRNLEGEEIAKTPGMIILFSASPPAGYIPLAGAGVSLDGITTATGNDGSFSFSGIPVGVKTLKAEHSDWIPLEQKTIVTDPQSGQRPFTGLEILSPVKSDLILSTSSGLNIPSVYNFESYGTGAGDSYLKPDVDWSVNPPGNIDSSGVFQTSQPGTYTVKAIARSDNPPSALLTFTVANTGGILYGYVKNNQAYPVADVMVSINNTGYFLITDERGYYEFSGVPSGPVSLTGTFAGLTGSTPSLTLNPGGAIQAPDIIIDTTVPSPIENPSPASWKLNKSVLTSLNSIFFPDSEKGWIAGDGGIILYTDNGGKNWFAVTGGTSENLSGIYFADRDTGWAVGNNGTVLYKSDDSTDWILQNSNTPENLTGLYFLNSTTGWICGEKGTILKTADGGTTWNKQFPGTSEDITDIYFSNLLYGRASCKKGIILYTSDGGETWKAGNTGIEESINSIDFINLPAGWTAGEKGTLMKTSDGGVNWLKSVTGTEENLKSISFIDPVNGWAAGENGTVLYSGDGGTTWIKQLSGTPGDLECIYFISRDRGWAVGEEDGEGIILEYSP